MPPSTIDWRRAAPRLASTHCGVVQRSGTALRLANSSGTGLGLRRGGGAGALRLKPTLGAAVSAAPHFTSCVPAERSAAPHAIVSSAAPSAPMRNTGADVPAVSTLSARAVAPSEHDK